MTEPVPPQHTAPQPSAPKPTAPQLTAPPPPAFPPPVPTPTATPAPAKRNRTNAVVITSAAAVIAAVVTTGLLVTQSTSTGDDDRPATTATPTTPDNGIVTAAEEPTPEPAYGELGTDSFTIGLRTTARHCFGSAGCNVTVEPQLTYLGDSGTIDPDATYEITYEIQGDESGPVIETAELTDQTQLGYTPSLISTASAGTEPSVEITDVQER